MIREKLENQQNACGLDKYVIFHNYDEIALGIKCIVEKKIFNL